jgi:hypothetical protein
MPGPTSVRERGKEEEKAGILQVFDKGRSSQVRTLGGKLSCSCCLQGETRAEAAQKDDPKERETKLESIDSPAGQVKKRKLISHDTWKGKDDGSVAETEHGDVPKAVPDDAEHMEGEDYGYDLGKRDEEFEFED